jgi:hypothetical protein
MALFSIDLIVYTPVRLMRSACLSELAPVLRFASLMSSSHAHSLAIAAFEKF